MTFGVELVFPWDAPEAVVDLHSVGVMDLETVSDVIGLTGQRPGDAVTRVLQGRDVRSICALVPDLWVRMMYHGTLNQLVWRSLFPCGWFSASLGYRLTCSCLAIPTFHWLIIIRCTSVGSRILLSEGIT